MDWVFRQLAVAKGVRREREITSGSCGKPWLYCRQRIKRMANHEGYTIDSEWAESDVFGKWYAKNLATPEHRYIVANLGSPNNNHLSAETCHLVKQDLWNWLRYQKGGNTLPGVCQWNHIDKRYQDPETTTGRIRYRVMYWNLSPRRKTSKDFDDALTAYRFFFKNRIDQLKHFKEEEENPVIADLLEKRIQLLQVKYDNNEIVEVF